MSATTDFFNYCDMTKVASRKKPYAGEAVPGEYGYPSVLKRMGKAIKESLKAAPGKAWKGIKAAPGKAWSGIKEAPGKAWKGIKAAPGAAWANKGKIGLGALAGIGLGAAGEHLRSNRD